MSGLLLSALIVLRLLMPPGICICKLSSPVFTLIAILGGSECPPAPAHDDHEDHLPGCPASHLAEGLGVGPPSGPGPILLALAGTLADVILSPIPAPASLPAPPDPIPFDSPPLYVAQCALLC
jgi:hypothetical protein